MSASTKPKSKTPTAAKNLVEMHWDPITRIVGSLGIFTKIDFENKQVAECYSTSSIFRPFTPPAALISSAASWMPITA